MLRLFVPGSVAPGDTVVLGPADAHHLRVRRLRAGDRLRLVDERGQEHDAVVADVAGTAGRVRVERRVDDRRESALDLVLAPALLKGAHMDLVVEKATELGVTRIVPMACRRAVARGDHLARWRRIAVAAAKQSGRTRVPAIDAVAPLDAVLAMPWPGLRLVPWEREGSARLDALPVVAAAVVAIVGPEGGFADDEVAAAVARGFVAVTLGPRILRAETAAIVIAARCQARWGDG